MIKHLISFEYSGLSDFLPAFSLKSWQLLKQQHGRTNIVNNLYICKLKIIDYDLVYCRKGQHLFTNLDFRQPSDVENNWNRQNMLSATDNDRHYVQS